MVGNDAALRLFQRFVHDAEEADGWATHGCVVSSAMISFLEIWCMLHDTSDLQGIFMTLWPFLQVCMGLTEEVGCGPMQDTHKKQTEANSASRKC
jgi:hypothetical protein